MDAGGVILGLVGTAIGLVITYYLIKAAVRNGMREHQEWLDEREEPVKKPAAEDAKTD